MSYSVFDPLNKKNHMKVKAFFDDPVTIARYDKQKYPFLEKLTKSQLGFFWLPEEINLTKDSSDFKELNEFEKHIFTSNLKRQILLDSLQGRSPALAFAPICSLPELETWIMTWTFSETIHSRSYTHIIRNIYQNPSEVFDTMLDIEEIVDCAKDISKNYDDLINYNYKMLMSSPHNYNLYEHKKALWLALVSANILEGVRFYVSFACSWAFAELKKMEGNAKIIKLICRDENLHLGFTQQLLKILPKDDEDFLKIKDETIDIIKTLYINCANQEKEWAKFLFKDGSIIGLNENILNEYIEYITTKRMNSLGVSSPYKINNDPLPWTQKWISGSDVQQAPQEVDINSYIIGSIKQDVSENTFKGFSL